MDKPGQIIYFDDKGEVMGTTSFHPGIHYGDPEHDGGVGIHEIGNRGTTLGMNMYADTNAILNSNETKDVSKYAPKDEESDPDPDLFPKVKVVNKTTPEQNCLSLGQNSNSGLAQDELNLLAKLIGTDFNPTEKKLRLNLLEQDQKDAEVSAKTEEKPKKSEEALEFDMKTRGKNRDQLLQKIVGDLEEVSQQENDEEDDLLALMDKAM